MIQHKMTREQAAEHGIDPAMFDACEGFETDMVALITKHAAIFKAANPHEVKSVMEDNVNLCATAMLCGVIYSMSKFVHSQLPANDISQHSTLPTAMIVGVANETLKEIADIIAQQALENLGVTRGGGLLERLKAMAERQGLSEEFAEALKPKGGLS